MVDIPLRELIAIPLEFLLLVFHVSVTVFIAAKSRKDALYRNAFFLLYLVQSGSNYLCFVTVSLRFQAARGLKN